MSIQFGLIIDSIYSNGEPLFLPTEGLILKETEKAVCFKGLDGTLLWFPKKAIKPHGKGSQCFVVAHWFKFSKGNAFNYFTNHVCSI